jgi:undecaprenyl-diphosphatase
MDANSERGDRPVNSTKKSPTQRAGDDRHRSGPGRPIAVAAVVVLGSAAVVVAVLVAVGLVVTHLLVHTVGSWDEHVNGWFARHRTPTDNTITADLTLLANTMGIVAVAAVVAAIAVIRHHLRLAIALVIALGVELGGFLLTNILVARPRPHVPHVGSTPSTFSWPSGHVAATLVLYGGVAVMVAMVTRRPALRILAWILPAIVVPGVAWSRIYRGEHHPTDTIAGLILGVAALVIGFAAVRSWPRTTATVGHTTRVDDRQAPPAPVAAAFASGEPASAPVGASHRRSA